MILALISVAIEPNMRQSNSHTLSLQDDGRVQSDQSGRRHKLDTQCSYELQVIPALSLGR